MPEMQVTVTWPPTEPVTLKSGTNPLQDSFIRLDQAEQLRQQGKLDRAQKVCETLLREHPDYVAALHTLGLVYADKKNYQQALNCLVRAAMLNRRSWRTLTALSGVYLQLGASEMAAQMLEQARAIRPQDTNVLTTLGEIYREEREYEHSRDAFRQAVALEENLVPAVTGLGWVCSHIGDNAEAAAAFEGLLKRGVRVLDILIALASLPRALVTVDLLSELDNLVFDSGVDRAKFENSAAFVRATALDKAGRYAEAWEYLVPANRTVFHTMREELKDSSERRRTMLASLRANSIKPRDNSQDAREPISLFILGPSRSGKTTMERLVSTLDGVKRGYENRIVENAIRLAFQEAGLLASEFFEMLPPQLYSSCREIYLEELDRRAASARVFTNTHPSRIYDAALISMVFPNVRFLFVKRNLEDTVLRVYQRKYDAGNSYSYDLKAARDYVVWYHQMMELMAEKLPAAVRIIRYEDIVADPSGALRAAAQLCGLSMTEKPLPPTGDDRGCAEPYREFMNAELAR